MKTYGWKGLITGRKRGMIVFLLIFVLVADIILNAGIITVHGEEKKETGLTLYARSAALMDAENGRLLYGKDPDQKLPMASTTKIMTLIVTLENAQLSDEVTFSKRAAGMPDVQLNAREGEVFVLEDLCYALMLESYNDVAVAIAEHVGGSVEGFADMMNQKAVQLGLTNSHFVTPNGLDAEEHYSTARDLCTLASYAIRNPKFLEIIQMQAYTFHELKTGKNYSVYNKDAFLTQYDGAIGIKTGFTGKAGYCFVGAVKKDDHVLVSAVLASGWPPDKTRKWSDTKKLMDYGMAHYQKRTVGTGRTELMTLPVREGWESEVGIRADLKTLSLLLGEQEEVVVKKKILKCLDAPVEKGKVVGTIQYLLNGKVLEQFPVYTTEAVKKRDFGYWLTTVVSEFFGFGER